jgi:hypothetical protein
MYKSLFGSCTEPLTCQGRPLGYLVANVGAAASPYSPDDMQLQILCLLLSMKHALDYKNGTQ